MAEALREMGYKVEKPDNFGDRSVSENGNSLGWLDKFNVFRTIPVYLVGSWEPTREDKIVKEAIGSLVEKDGLDVEYVSEGGETPILVIKARPEPEYMKKAIEWLKILNSTEKFEIPVGKIAIETLENAEKDAKEKIVRYVKQLKEKINP
jgi:hypothetical protein